MGTREKKPVTFRCEFCSLEVTEAHAPGPMPRYCAACYVEAQRSLNRQRVCRHREAHDTREWFEKRPPGRPRKP